MKYRKWDPKTKMRIVLEGMGNKMPLAELCNKYQIGQGQFYYWLKELQSKGHKVFESEKQTKKEQRLLEEINKLKRIIAELSIELKKTELELQEGGEL
ncbi:MAG TPA: transposase [Candidatus Brocadiia bacterium]|nr:transposase [Candidatus Brocadiales bacterium]